MTIKNDDKNKISSETVIVAGRNYCNILTIARALGSAGYKVEILRVHKSAPSALKPLSKMKPEAYSKYICAYHQCIVENESDGVVGYLKKIADKSKKKMLVPVDDYMRCEIDNRLDELSENYLVSSIGGKSGAITNLMDKNRQKELASMFELPVLHGCIIKSENGQFNIPEDTHYPCFIKPNVSTSSTKSKMKVCKSRNELQHTLSKYAKSGDFEMLVEEYANIKAEYSILGICTGNAVAAPGIFKVIEGGTKNRKGVALIGEMIPSDALNDITEKSKQFIKSLGYTGMFDIDLIETKSGKIYFVELNFRAGASTQALTKSGVNLPSMLAAYLYEGRKIDENCSIADYKKFVSEKILLEEYARGDVRLSKVRKCMKIADVYFIKDEDDPKPYNYFRRFYFIATLMRLVYKISDAIKG